MEHLARFAEQTTPVFNDLKVAAPGIDKAFTSLPAFSTSSTAFFKSLGSTAKISGPALTSLQPLLARLGVLGKEARPFSFNAAELLSSLRSTGGLERILDFIFLGAGAANGYDSLGHFLRSEAVGTACLTYAVVTAAACANAKLFSTSSSSSGTAATSARARAASTTSVVEARTLAVLKGATPAEAVAKYPGPTDTTAGTGAGAGSSATPAAAAAPVGGASAGTTYYTPSDESSGADGMLLKYLLGN